ncbi:MAG: substrate-binding domain-containing protein [Anaerolineales bacterium]|nr:substrate-binding domain-containing protein [Anaerolineales bacterium]
MTSLKALLAASATALLLLTACSSPPAPASSMDLLADPSAAPAATAETAAPAARAPTVALVMKTLTNPFFVEMEKGARQAEKDLGINLIVKTAAEETSIEQQIEIVGNLIDDGVDAIVLAPADSTGLIPVVKRAQDNGVVVINIDNPLDAKIAAQRGLAPIPFISVDNEQGAYTSAKFLSDQVSAPVEAVILEGIRTAQNANDRKHGAERAFGENALIKIVAEETANWKIDEAHAVISKIFSRHPNVKVVFAANDMMALGVLKYLEETGRNDVLVASYDALEEAVAAVKTGELQATVDQQAAQQGYMGVESALKALHGDELPVLTLVDTKLITAAALK